MPFDEQEEAWLRGLALTAFNGLVKEVQLLRTSWIAVHQSIIQSNDGPTTSTPHKDFPILQHLLIKGQRFAHHLVDMEKKLQDGDCDVENALDALDYIIDRLKLMHVEPFDFGIGSVEDDDDFVPDCGGAIEDLLWVCQCFRFKFTEWSEKVAAASHTLPDKDEIPNRCASDSAPATIGASSAQPKTVSSSTGNAEAQNSLQPKELHGKTNETEGSTQAPGHANPVQTIYLPHAISSVVTHSNDASIAKNRDCSADKALSRDAAKDQAVCIAKISATSVKTNEETSAMPIAVPMGHPGAEIENVSNINDNKIALSTIQSVNQGLVDETICSSNPPQSNPVVKAVDMPKVTGPQAQAKSQSKSMKVVDLLRAKNRVEARCRAAGKTTSEIPGLQLPNEQNRGDTKMDRRNPPGQNPEKSILPEQISKSESVSQPTVIKETRTATTISTARPHSQNSVEAGSVCPKSLGLQPLTERKAAALATSRVLSVTQSSNNTVLITVEFPALRLPVQPPPTIGNCTAVPAIGGCGAGSPLNADVSRGEVVLSASTGLQAEDSRADSTATVVPAVARPTFASHGTAVTPFVLKSTEPLPVNDPNLLSLTSKSIYPATSPAPFGGNIIDFATVKCAGPEPLAELKEGMASIEDCSSAGQLHVDPVNSQRIEDLLEIASVSEELEEYTLEKSFESCDRSPQALDQVDGLRSTVHDILHPCQVSSNQDEELEKSTADSDTMASARDTATDAYSNESCPSEKRHETCPSKRRNDKSDPHNSGTLTGVVQSPAGITELLSSPGSGVFEKANSSGVLAEERIGDSEEDDDEEEIAGKERTSEKCESSDDTSDYSEGEETSSYSCDDCE